MRVAAEREAEEERNRWRRTAFLAYQFGAQYRKTPLSFGQYLSQMGLASPLAQAPGASEDLVEVKKRAMAIGERIRAMDQAR